MRDIYITLIVVSKCQKEEESHVNKIIKIIRVADWEKAQANSGIIEPSLTTEGFIHCSYANQIAGTVAKHFSTEEHVLLLVVNEEKVRATLKVELAKNGEYYPHIYAPIPVDAIDHTYTVTKNENGAFTFPTL
jgi:uncharacterized protein (DUF952 family)